MDRLEEYKYMPISRMSREDKVKRYLWQVNGLNGVIDTWRRQMSEPKEYNVFNDWEQCEAHGRGITELIDEMAELAVEVEPDAVPLWQQMRQTIADLRIIDYNTMKRLHDTPDPPMPTPEEEAAEEAEMVELYAKIGKKPPEPERPTSVGTGD